MFPINRYQLLNFTCAGALIFTAGAATAMPQIELGQSSKAIALIIKSQGGAQTKAEYCRTPEGRADAATCGTRKATGAQTKAEYCRTPEGRADAATCAQKP
jgi:hypothetical protein